MSGMLHHQDLYREGIDRHQREAERWARERSLGRLARMAREQLAQPGTQARILAIGAPSTALLLIVVVAGFLG